MQHDRERGGEGEDRERNEGYIQKKKKQRKEGLEQRQERQNQRDGWGERIWMREQRRCFCKRRVIKDLPKMPEMLRVPLWLLIWKLMRLIWGFEGDVQLEVIVEPLMSCWRRLGSHAMLVVFRNNMISLLAQSWIYCTVHVVLSPTFENLPENYSRKGIFSLT